MFKVPIMFLALTVATHSLVMAAPEIVGDTKGHLVSIDAAKSQFEMKFSGGEKRIYKLGEDATTYINNRVAAFNDLRAGDQISVTDHKGDDAWYAIIIKCERPGVAEATKGQMLSIDAAKLQFEMKVNGGETRSYKLGEDATTYINDRVVAFRDLRAGDQISVTDRKSDDAWYAIIIKCERPVAAAGVVEATKGQVLSIDTAKLQFEMKLIGGEKRGYKLGEDATTYINDRVAAFNDLRAGDQISVTDREGDKAWYAIIIKCERK